MKRKVTVTLPQDLITFVDRVATEQGVSRSRVIVDLLAACKRRDDKKLAVEGYIFYASEATEFAQMSQQASVAAWGEYHLNNLR